MIADDYTAGLHRLTTATWAYLQPPGTWGWSNCGLVTDHAGERGVLIDTQFTLPLTQTLLSTIRQTRPQLRLDAVVTTHANGDHCWGNQLLSEIPIIGSAATAHGMEDEVTPAALTAMSTSGGDSALEQYMRQFFGHFDFTGIRLTPPTVTFTGATQLQAGDTVVDLFEVGPAHTSGDVIAWVPDERVLYTGDILFVGDHPIMWSGPLDGWIIACDRIIDLDPLIVVPGHGPVTNTATVTGFRAYLAQIGVAARQRFEAGMPYWKAALDIPAEPGWAAWGHRERLVITIATLYRQWGDDTQTGLLDVLTHTAAAWRRLAG